jgi:membrane protease subunit (stomatin/prohibitin family)
MADFIDQKWGTMEPVTFRDSQFGMVRLRAFGTYSMAVADPQLFVNKIVGTQGIYDTGQITDYLRSIIVSRFNDIMGKTMTTLLDLPARYNDVGAGMRASVTDDFANLGLNVKAFYVTSITPPDEVSQKIDQRTSMGVLGDMNQYMQYQTAQAIGGIGQGGGGGGAGGAAETGLGLGAGMGIGAGMAQMVSQNMANAQQQSQAQQQQAQQAAGQQQQAAANDPVAKLQQLKDMLDKGLITQDIYDAKRNDILSKM